MQRFDDLDTLALLTLAILALAYAIAMIAGRATRNSDVLPPPTRDALRGKVGTDWHTVTRNPE